MKNLKTESEVRGYILNMIDRHNGVRFISKPVAICEALIDRMNGKKGLYVYKVICPMKNCKGELERLRRDIRCMSKKCQFETTITKLCGSIGETMFPKDTRESDDNNEH